MMSNVVQIKEPSIFRSASGDGDMVFTVKIEIPEAVCAKAAEALNLSLHDLRGRIEATLKKAVPTLRITNFGLGKDISLDCTITEGVPETAHMARICKAANVPVSFGRGAAPDIAHNKVVSSDGIPQVLGSWETFTTAVESSVKRTLGMGVKVAPKANGVARGGAYTSESGR